MQALRSLLAFVVLSLWWSPAGAFCVAEFAYDYVMREDGPAPGQSLPSREASTPPPLAVEKDRPIEGRLPSIATGYPIPESHDASGICMPAPSPLRWRSYCERSTRLLR